ncbi:MAG: TolC family protein, partial [Clostridia bacterium]
LNSYMVGEGFVVETAETSLRIAQRSLEQAEFGVKLQVYQQFYSYLNAVRKVELAKTSVANAQKRNADAKELLSDGLISRLEARSAELSLKEAENNLTECERNADYILRQLKSVMGYPSEKELIPDGVFERKAPESTSVSDAIELSMNGAEMLNEADSFALQEKLYDIYKKWYLRDWLLDSHTAEFYSEKAKHENALRENELAIVESCNNMKKAYEALEYIDEAIALSESGLEAKETSYQLGLITSSEYLEACSEYDDLLMQRADLELTAYLASVSYRSHFTFEFEDEENMTESSDDIAG